MRKTPTLFKLLFTLMLVVLGTTLAVAQTTVNGRVTNSKNGAPVPGATVTVKGTGTSVQTGSDGNFSIRVPSQNSILIISSIGFTPIETNFRPGSELEISFVEQNQQLQDVVVVAYGTRKKTDLTGSVVSVGVKDFQKGNINSTEQLLVGKVAGLEVTTGGGSAGGGSKLRIRGTSSLNASNEPLIVIDDVPVEGNGIAGSANLLNTLNPDDIESISVLKDASATALYGSRASNGVMIITTKKGRRGKVLFNFNTRLSVAHVSDKVDVLTGDQVRSLIRADADASGNTGYAALLDSFNTDWQDQIYRTALGLDNNISASGSLGKGNINLPFRASLGYLTQEGTLKTNKFERISTSLNLSPKLLKERLAVNLALKYAHTDNVFADEGAIGSAVNFDPTQNIYDRSGSGKYGGYFQWLRSGTPINTNGPSVAPNPLDMLMLRNNTSKVNRIIGNIKLDYHLPWVEGLHAIINLGADLTSGKGNDNIDSASVTNWHTKGRFTAYEEKKKNYLTDVSLFYTREVPKLRSRFDVLVGHTYQQFITENTFNPSYGQDGVVIPTSVPSFSTDKPEYRLESYLGRVNFTIHDKYLLTGSIRRDASSKFSEDNRVGYFPSAAFAWKLKEEFFPSLSKMNELKLRLGWGVTGQQDGIANYGYIPRYTASQNDGASYQFGDQFYSFLRPAAYDANLKWETTTTTNIGLDFGFFNGRISGAVDVYKKKTKDLLSTVPIAPGANFDISLLTNVGNMENKGVEVSINTVPVKKPQLQWDLGFNFTYNETEITNLLKYPDAKFVGIDAGAVNGGTGNFIGKYAVGYAPFTFFTYKQVYDAAGKPIEGLFEDLNRDGTIDNDDRYFYTKPAPDVMLGFNTQVTYKKFSLGVAAHGSFGNYLYNNLNSNAATLNSIKDNLVMIRNAPVNYLETGFRSKQFLSDYYIENASFLKIDNINFGYNFGRIYRNKASLRLNASIQNVATFTKYSGLDPENSSSAGTDNTIYPRPRIYSVGASLDF